MNRKNLGIFGVLLLVSSVAVYAHGSEISSSTESKTFQMIDEMHEEMIEGLEPELKEEMDLMHEGCMSSFGEEKLIDHEEEMMSSENTNTNMMGDTITSVASFTGMMGNAFDGIMSGMMMG